MKVFLAICKTKDKKPYTKHLWPWKIKESYNSNKIFHLEGSMVMYSIYNSDTLEATY